MARTRKTLPARADVAHLISAGVLARRVKSNLKLPVEQLLADGSYLSRVFDSADRHRSAGQIVRVIDYTLQDSATPPQDSYRLGAVSAVAGASTRVASNAR
ncbi:transposase, IS4 family protein [Pseudoxanthomonas spadix BD-a59]|uniref:Transposase, IS4 family protein n=1 Tax=Pseudoxanthomonas spadix (strain BD-a59) TaxID=1045855 RepID=G7UQZ4_PSEUP|nr:transposase, IS4 family protein [Pseudoxanthomonas spadix BD-a59]